MNVDFTNINHLKSGDLSQRNAFFCLEDLNILNDLKMYNPILAGTIPIGINIASSDLDIICDVRYDKLFNEKILKLYNHHKEFSRKTRRDAEVFSFFYKEFKIEIFCKARDVYKQNAWIHMMIENRLLNLADADFKKKIISLKKQGYKTEPAFGKLLKLNDPYSDMISLNDKNDSELIKILDDYAL